MINDYPIHAEYSPSARCFHELYASEYEPRFAAQFVFSLIKISYVILLFQERFKRSI